MRIKKQEIEDFKLNDDVIELLKLSYYEAISLITFHIFIIEVAEEETLEKEWSKVYNKIAFYMQDKFKSAFEKWNLYLFYIIGKDCSISLKYEIENNPFSSRKIVIENNSEKKMSHEQIINNYIFDSDIKLNSKELIQLKELKQEGKIFNLIKASDIELSLDGRNKDKSVEVIYEKLLKTYTDEV